MQRDSSNRWCISICYVETGNHMSPLIEIFALYDSVFLLHYLYVEMIMQE